MDEQLDPADQQPELQPGQRPEDPGRRWRSSTPCPRRSSTPSRRSGQQLDEYLAKKAYIAAFGNQLVPKFISNKMNFASIVLHPRLRVRLDVVQQEVDVDDGAGSAYAPGPVVIDVMTATPPEFTGTAFGDTIAEPVAEAEGADAPARDRPVRAGLAAAAPQQGRAGVRRAVPADRRAVPAGAGLRASTSRTPGPTPTHITDQITRRRQASRTSSRPTASRSGRRTGPLLPRRRLQRPRRRGAAALRRTQLAGDRLPRDADHDGPGHAASGSVAGYRRGTPGRACSAGILDIIWSFPVVLLAVALGTALALGGINLGLSRRSRATRCSSRR